MLDEFGVAFDELLIATRLAEAHLKACSAQALVLHVALRTDQAEATTEAIEFHGARAAEYGRSVEECAQVLTSAYWAAQRGAAHDAALAEDAAREAQSEEAETDG
jgi:hypothetical protein